MASKKFVINPDLNSISMAVEEIQATLNGWGCKREQVTPAVLTIEELLVDIQQKNDSDERIFLYLKKGLRKTYATITFKGQQFALKDSVLMPLDGGLSEDIDPTAEDVIHNMVINIMRKRFSARYSRGVNTIRVAVDTSDKSDLIDCLASIFLAIIVGLFLRYILPDGGEDFIAANILQPMYLIFLRAMQMIIAPLIFFSLASSIADLTDLSSLGRTGGKMMLGYMFTTMIAILLSLGIDAVSMPGTSGDIIHPDAGATTFLGNVPEISPSIKSLIINLMPNNFLGTFVASDMLQIIILAIICAITTGRMGQYSGSVKRGIDMMNTFFGTLTAGIARFLPLAIFGSFASMVLTTDISSLSSISYWGMITAIALLAMFCVYSLIILIFARLNPLVFLKKYFPATLTALSSSSSSATMPTSMDCCRRMGVSSSIYSFSIPLGCTINMDGFSILLITTVMFLARVYGVELDSNTLISMLTMVMLLSIALPGVPGAGMAAYLSLLALIGVPAEGLTLVLGLLPILELLGTAVNVTGDGAITTIVAKSENKLDTNQYHSAS